MRKCFTRRVDFQRNVRKMFEVIVLHKDILDNMTKLNNDLVLEIFIHYPRHQVRSLKANIAAISLNTKTKSQPNLVVRMSGIRVTRRRPDANTPWNPNTDNQDAFFRKSVINEIGCIPPYWTSLVGKSDYNVSVCGNSTELRKAFSYSDPNNDFYRHRDTFLGGENSPCTEMWMISNVREENVRSKSDRNVRLLVKYQVDQYMYIVNSKAYLCQDLLSSIGGYIGMFLGFGLLQIPEIVCGFSGFATRGIKHIKGEN